MDRCFFFRLFSVTLILSTVISNANSQNNPYEDCKKQFQCGNFTGLGYPFWGGNRQQSCGHPAFRLNCSAAAANSPPTITIQSWEYRVLSIDNPSKSLTVARNDFFDHSCPTTPQNATLDNSVFNYAADVANLTLYYNCVQLQNFNTCNTAAGNASFNFYVSTSSASSANSSTVLGCNSSVNVQVSQASDEALLTNSPSFQVKAALDRGFGLVWSADDRACGNCAKSGGVCGSSNGSAFLCHCPDGRGVNRGKCGSGKFPLGLALGIGLPSILLLVLAAILGLYFFKRSRKGKTTTSPANVAGNRNVELFMKNYGSHVPKRYSYRQIEKITKSFSEKQGQGGFGTVYKGKLENGQLVAVKLLKEAGGDSHDFMNEVESISLTSHVNVVSLLGFCYQGKKRALLYEFMPNGSLDRFISDDPSLRLGLKLLYQIVIGIARGLEYLHQGCTTRIVHFDIKPHNILLDEEFCPKISDFGLAKLCKKKQSVMSTVDQRGTIGYIAPEVSSRAFGKASHKSDVYSYGMMVLEMAGAKEIKEVEDSEAVQTSEMYFPDCIYERVVKGKDLKLPNATTDEDKEMGEKMILVGLWCIQINPSQRPSMSEVVKMLEGSVEAIEIPPKPFKFSPPRSMNNSSESSVLSEIQ